MQATLDTCQIISGGRAVLLVGWVVEIKFLVSHFSVFFLFIHYCSLIIALFLKPDKKAEEKPGGSNSKITAQNFQSRRNLQPS